MVSFRKETSGLLAAAFLAGCSGGSGTPDALAIFAKPDPAFERAIVRAKTAPVIENARPSLFPPRYEASAAAAAAPVAVAAPEPALAVPTVSFPEMVDTGLYRDVPVTESLPVPVTVSVPSDPVRTAPAAAPAAIAEIAPPPTVQPVAPGAATATFEPVDLAAYDVVPAAPLPLDGTVPYAAPQAPAPAYIEPPAIIVEPPAPAYAPAPEIPQRLPYGAAL